MSSTALAAGGIIAVKKLIETITAEFYSQVKVAYKGKLDKVNIVNDIATLYAKIEEVGKVKTIWQTDKAVPLSSFYCDTHILHNKVRKIARSVSDINVEGNILIEGIAGQGKSIFMRSLCVNELRLGTVIPVFIELRRLLDEKHLMPTIFSKFRELELSVDHKLFEFLCRTNRILLLLDGFDEVQEKIQKQVLNEIDEIANTYKGIKIIVSSRPESGLEYLPTFSVVKVDYVKDDEYVTIVNKLCDNPELAKNLTDCVNNHKGSIKSLLCTPLMVTLLVITYKSFQKVPEQLSDFFEDMFHTMLQRHDGTKPAYTRERKCDLNDFQYQRVFEALCFVTKEKGVSFKEAVMNEAVINALKLSNLEVDPQNYTEDISKITCLLVFEGREFRFLHKSIQEYFAASFIKYKPDNMSSKFYSKLLNDGYKWNEELLYLEQIDSYRFLKYFLIPISCKMLSLNSKEAPQKINSKNYENILEYTRVFKTEQTEHPIYGYASILRLLFSTTKLEAKGRTIRFEKFILNKDIIKNRQAVLEIMPEVDDGFRLCTLSHLLENKLCVEVIWQYAELAHEAIHRCVLDAQKELKTFEATDFMAFMLDA